MYLMVSLWTSCGIAFCIWRPPPSRFSTTTSSFVFWARRYRASRKQIRVFSLNWSCENEKRKISNKLYSLFHLIRGHGFQFSVMSPVQQLSRDPAVYIPQEITAQTWPHLYCTPQRVPTLWPFAPWREIK